MVHIISLPNAGYSTTKHDYSHFLKIKNFPFIFRLAFYSRPFIFKFIPLHAEWMGVIALNCINYLRWTNRNASQCPCHIPTNCLLINSSFTRIWFAYNYFAVASIISFFLIQKFFSHLLINFLNGLEKKVLHLQCFWGEKFCFDMRAVFIWCFLISFTTKVMAFVNTVILQEQYEST